MYVPSVLQIASIHPKFKDCIFANTAEIEIWQYKSGEQNYLYRIIYGSVSFIVSYYSVTSRTDCASIVILMLFDAKR